MTANVEFCGIERDNSIKFRLSNGVDIYVLETKDDIWTIEVGWGITIKGLAEGLVEDFDFFENLYGVKAFDIIFNNAHVLVDKKNADPDNIVKLYEKSFDEYYRKEYEEYKKTPEYRNERKKELKTKFHRQKVRNKVREIVQTEEFQFKDEEARKLWQDNVSRDHSSYSDGVFHYAECWAKFMQYLMNKHNVTVEKIAKNTSRDANLNGGLSIYQFGCAVKILSQIWKYGEELRIWHNKEYGYEGNGVVNPALLTISVG